MCFNNLLIISGKHGVKDRHNMYHHVSQITLKIIFGKFPEPISRFPVPEKIMHFPIGNGNGKSGICKDRNLKNLPQKYILFKSCFLLKTFSTRFSVYSLISRTQSKPSLLLLNIRIVPYPL